jgi:hypothetical protein
MPIDFRCPAGHKLSVDNSLAGRKARCPLCKQKMWVPAENSEPNRFAEAVEGDSEPASVVVVADDAASDPSQPPVDIYRPDAGKLQTVHLLAIGMALAALFAAAPALRHINLAAAPDWARLVILISAVQLAYVAWMVSLPDFSSVWVVMLVYAVVTAAYCAGMALFMYTPADAPLVLGLGEPARYSGAGWCAAVVLLNGMMTFVAGRTSAGWRRTYEIALRRRRGG